MTQPLNHEILKAARELIEQGYSLRRTARTLGISHPVLIAYGMRSAGHHQHPAEVVREARERYAAGESIKMLSASLKVPIGSVSDWVWGRSRRDAGGPMLPRPRAGMPRGGSCERLCRHWTDGGCGIGFPPEDWSTRYCGGFTPRS
jgi:hypothetical protein